MTTLPPLHPMDQYNQSLLNHVHPSDYKNPVPTGRYNLVVIGAGTGGLVTAAAAAGLGAKVALVERAFLGGDCLNYGCVPSKTILRSAHAAQSIREATAFGIHADEPRIDFPAVMERVRKVRSDISPHDSVKRFSDLGVEIFLGSGVFTDSETVRVGDIELKFSKAVVATGARAFVPAIEGLEEQGYRTNETIFNLTEKPERLLVLGGGPIGCELAQAFQQLGVQVTLVQSAPQVLPREDKDAASILTHTMQKQGIDIRFSRELIRVYGDQDEKVATLKTSAGEETVTVDEILIATGRAPNVTGLGLEAVGVEFDERYGIRVDDTLKTSNPNIYAVGDVCLPYKFTHAADFAARTVIRNALFSFLPTKAKFSNYLIPWVTYTQPEIAHVGLSEQNAESKGIKIDTYQKNLEDNDRSMAEGEGQGFVKIHTRKGTDKIVGATIVANHAGEMLNEITLAMSKKIGLGAIASVIHPYPTQAEAIRQCGDLYNRTRLTQGKKKVLEKIFSWMR